MLAETLVALAALAGNTVVAAATTDAWEAAKRGFARLLGRGDPERAKVLEGRLAETQDQLSEAEDADLDRVRAVLQGQWATRVADLMEEDPGVETELRALLRDIQARLPAGTASAVDHSVAVGRDLNIKATSGGVAAGVIHGNVMAPGPTLPGPASR